MLQKQFDSESFKIKQTNAISCCLHQQGKFHCFTFSLSLSCFPNSTIYCFNRKKNEQSLIHKQWQQQQQARCCSLKVSRISSGNKLRLQQIHKIKIQMSVQQQQQQFELVSE